MGVIEDKLLLKSLDIDLSVDQSQDALNRYVGEISIDALEHNLKIIEREIECGAGAPGISKICGTRLHNNIISAMRSPLLEDSNIPNYREQLIFRYLDTLPDLSKGNTLHSQSGHFVIKWMPSVADAFHGLNDNNKADELLQLLEDAYDYLVTYLGDRDMADLNKGHAANGPSDPMIIHLAQFKSEYLGVALEIGPIWFNVKYWNDDAYEYKRRPAVIHELFHKFQYSYGLTSSQSDMWMLEGMGHCQEMTFRSSRMIPGAEIYPASPLELEASFNSPIEKLTDLSYEAAPFWYYMNALQSDFASDFLKEYETTIPDGIAALKRALAPTGSGAVTDSLDFHYLQYARSKRLPPQDTSDPFNYFVEYFLNEMRHPENGFSGRSHSLVDGYIEYIFHQSLEYLTPEYYRFYYDSLNLEKARITISADTGVEIGLCLLWEESTSTGNHRILHADTHFLPTNPFSIDIEKGLHGADQLIIVMICKEGKHGRVRISATRVP